MSGHSKWSQIKHKKTATDQKRSQLFSKLLRAVSIAARNEPNTEFNPRLRSAVEKAKQNNVPNENIQRAIIKANEAKNLEELVIEAYGPERVAIIILAITDNKNRTFAEVRALLKEYGAKIADQGNVIWSFSPPSSKDNEWQPKFNQPVPREVKDKINALIENLESHEDVQKVITNMAQ